MRWIMLIWFAGSFAYISKRGAVRFGFWRQLSDHSTFLAPINCLCYMLSRLKAQPYIPEDSFPELAELKKHCWGQYISIALIVLYKGL